MHKPTILIAAAALLFASSCQRKYTDTYYPDTSGTPYVLVQNGTERQFNYVMYNSIEEYRKDGLAFIREMLPPQGRITKTPPTHERLSLYYPDWYSDDYMYARWNHTGHMPGREYTPDGYYLNETQPYGTFYIMQSWLDTLYHSDLRLRFLNGNQRASSWKVVDICRQNRFDASDITSVWSESTPAQRSTELTIRKHLVATLFTDTAVRDDLRFRTVSDRRPMVNFAGPHIDLVYDANNHITICGRIPEYRNMGIDSAIMFDNNTFTAGTSNYRYFYVLKR